MSSNTSASPEPAPKTKASTTKKVSAKKSTSKSKHTVSHPSWKDIIAECIIANRDDSARTGVSRSTIKKFALEMYKLDSTGTGLYQLNRAISSGVESGVFVLPKGPSGKVKLAPKAKTPAVNENTKPPSTKKAPAAAKPKVTKVVKKVPVTKKPPTKKAAVKKVAAPAKKITSTKRVERKKVAVKTAVKKTAVKTTAKAKKVR